MALQEYVITLSLMSVGVEMDSISSVLRLTLTLVRNLSTCGSLFLFVYR